MGRLLDFLLPPVCALCSLRVHQTASLCADCWGKINFITDPYCDRCGYPFEVQDTINPQVCAVCLTHSPEFYQHRSALYYDDHSKPLLMNFKHGDGTHLVPLFSRWLALSGKSLLEQCEVIVPVPLHWRRLFQRRYNQAALLAQTLCNQFNKIYGPQALCRHRATASQGTKTSAQRYKNIQGAIGPGSQSQTCVTGKKVLLIDDVFTSGATVQECVKVLLKHQAASVSVLTLARVV